MALPNERIAAGQNFILTFGYAGGWTGGPLKGDIRSVLAGWAPFATAKFLLLDVLSGGNSIVLTLAAQPGAELFTFGGIGAAIAQTLNTKLPGWSIVLTGLNAIGRAEIPGTGTTTWGKQFEQAGGITLSPFADVTPQAGPSWIPVALLAAAAVAIFLVASR